MNTKILVVDDEPDLQALILAKFRKAIKNNEFEFFFASNGEEALTLLENNPQVGIILTDINMPVMDGLTLLNNLPKLNRIYKAVVVSAYGDMSNIRSAMNNGASDFITKPIDFNDFEMTVKKMIQEFNFLSDAKIHLQDLYQACERFVPTQFIKELGKKSIIDVHLGDQVPRDMSVLFCDIRDFTSMAEKLTSGEIFTLLNEFLGQMEPIIHQRNGFIDKYIGDAIMALFNKPDDAVDAAIEMIKQTKLKIGIGINSGGLILGILGSSDRIDGSVIGDTVNVANRLEGLTKLYKVPLLISDDTKLKLSPDNKYNLRFADEANIKGKNKPVSIWEVSDGDPEAVRQAKIKNLPLYEEARKLYQAKEWDKAKELFKKCLAENSADTLAEHYIKVCEQKLL